MVSGANSHDLAVSVRRAGCSAFQMVLSCVSLPFEHCSPGMRRTYMRADARHTCLADQTLLRPDPLLMRGGASRQVRVPPGRDHVYTSHQITLPNRTCLVPVVL